MQAHLFQVVGSGAAVEVLIWLMLSDVSLFSVFHIRTHAQENDITWSYLLTMEKEDLEKVKDCNICLSVSSFAHCQPSG